MLPKPKKSFHCDVLEESDYEASALHSDSSGDSGSDAALRRHAGHLSGGGR